MSDPGSLSKKKKTGSMAFATALVMLGLIFSKCSGLLRSIVISHVFDPVYRDSFLLAFNIPDLIYNLLIGGSIQSAITPSLAASISSGKEKEGFRAVSIFISVLSVVLLAVCVIGVVFAEPIYRVIYSGENYHPETIHLAAMASRWLFPQIFFMMLAALSIGILNAYKRFGSTAFGPTIYNIFVLLAIFFLGGSSEKHLTMATAGVMGAALIYFLFQFTVGFDKLKQFRFEFRPTDPEFISLFKRALPILISASVVQINLVILNSFVLYYPMDGLVMALNNAITTWQLPYGIFAVAVGNVMLPSLASFYSVRKYSEASELLSSRLKSALFMTIPSAVFMVMFNDSVIRALFQWSPKYTDSDVSNAGALLTGFCIAIVTHTVIFIMNQAFYAIGKTKIPLIAGSIGLITNPLFCYIFVKIGFGFEYLSLSYSLTSIVQMTVLCVVYCRNKDLAPKNMISFLIKGAGCALIMGVVLFIAKRYIILPFGKINQLITIAIMGVIAVVTYFGSALIMRMPEALYWMDKVKSRIQK